MSKDTTINITSLTKEEQQFITERKLDDKYFIGRFNEKESGYLVSDIRRSDFSKIKYKPENSEAFTMRLMTILPKTLKTIVIIVFHGLWSSLSRIMSLKLIQN